MAEPKASHSTPSTKPAAPSTVPGTVQPYPSNNNMHGKGVKAPKAAQKPGAAAAPAGPKDTFREIVETVVFVVVLVLLLKSFVAEAFVIPTGSMAETLYGYQKIVTCPKCHEVFPVNCSIEVDPQQFPNNTDVVGCTCPNCRYEIDFKKEGMKPPWHTGDRVLVAKSVYDLKLLPGDKPKRRDVVVFKYPKEPQRAFTPMNYIKRLIGLPGETVAIHYGKIYVYDGLQYADSNVDPLNLWELRYTHQDDSQALDLFHKGKFRMVRKSPSEILAVRRKVYDNDHQAADLIGKAPPRWAADGTTSWQPDKPDEPKRFEHAAADDKEVAWLRYHHLIPDAGYNRTSVHPELITDFMGYNTWRPERGPHGTPPQNWVGDLLLEAEVDVQQTQGELVFELSKGVDRFRARWDLATGRCALSRVSSNQDVVLEEADTGLKKPGHYRLRFANIDERLTVWVDSSLPFGEGVVYEAPLRLGPTVENDLQPASIGVKGAGVTVSHLKLWRDIYYTTHADNTQQADTPANVRFDDPESWKNALSDLHPSTMYVQPGHYLCLGDNSPDSSDGRSWGLVPERLLLGRAMLIYYPVWPISPRAGLIR